MNKPPEIIPGDKSLRLNLYIVFACYVLVLISLEPIIDFFLLLGVNVTDPQAMQLVNQQKHIISNMAYAVLRMIPMVFFAWLGYRSLASARIPPARMRFPFDAPLIKGRNAKMLGILLITLSLLLISQDMVYLAKQMLH